MVPTHIPVFLTEVIELINVQPAGTYIDATFGRGGHSRSLLERLDSDGRLLAIDRDPEAIASAKQLGSIDPRLTVAKSPFSQLGEVAADLHGRVDGIVFDLGISSPQVDDASRGFSFRADGPLDMRMDPEGSVSAADWLHRASEKEISDVLWQYGDERRSRQIARQIVDARKSSPITTTFELASLVRSCMPYKGGRIDPATRTFQAIRLHVNDELGELQMALEAAFDLLAVGGRVLVIAFHSLEDRIVKRRFRDLDRLRRVSDKSGQSLSPAFALLASKPVMASEAERRANPRSRSARLRALERTA